eukprot:TRINITY_DN7985_c0_g1_i1.p1 TRINITY_DN7985_c0_g1~~TRINITY_DN7985_c0_g1_i1.p1  ORF type:complete len:362 (-),score=66.76 TRINITY_DN7985_c0_g1_i1:192-1154(-)
MASTVKTAIVVGGTSGIGRGIALWLAGKNVSVTVVGRSVSRGNEVVDQMNTITAAATITTASSTSSSPTLNHSFVPCDAMSLGNVAAMAKKYVEDGNDSLDFLVLSQGMATLQGRTLTQDGLDQKMTLHYYSRIKLIESLLPLLKASDDPRVLSVLSGGVHSPYEHYRDDPEMIDHYSLSNVANAAGFYNDLAMDALARENEGAGVSFIHAAPGFVNTNWGTEMPWIVRGLIRVLQVLGRTPQDCARAMSKGLFDDEYKNEGYYIINASGNPAKTTLQHNEEARSAVWDHTLDVLRRVTGEKEKGAEGVSDPSTEVSDEL